MRIVLASASPRRRELLTAIGITDFAVIPAKSEEPSAHGLSPEETVKEISLFKARDILHEAEKDDLIIAADTLVYLDDKPIGKPKDKEDAKRMLTSLSGRTHSVVTGLAVLYNGKEISAVEKTDVTFRSMDESEIDWYISTGEPMDKAGAYGAQGKGTVFIEKINGDYFNVVGLPIGRLMLTLRELGFSVTQLINSHS